MSPNTTNLATMFADISGSTRLFETLGDITAKATVSETLNLLTKVIQRHNGTIIKTIGDEIMCTFPTADDSANAAVEIQETLEEANKVRKADAPEIKIRVGLHFGPTLLEDGDVFGDAVNVAARMVAQAKGGQIITTKSTVDLLPPAIQASTRFVDRATIKGKQKDIEIFEIIWQEEDSTRIATGMFRKPTAPEVLLEVAYNGKTVVLDKNKPGLVMGRSQACDLPINEKLASRQHVRIELRRNKFFIIDQSTNGSHIRMDNSDDVFLRREEMPISGNGKISLGKSFAQEPTEVVTFMLKTKLKH